MEPQTPHQVELLGPVEFDVLEKYFGELPDVFLYVASHNFLQISRFL
ncbi:MAG: hypothetical protein MJA27_13695 [Pseudanabaenales cyanobacterium]|nr:hypothetical protein [Pseudanabaenales cyanobacterium]